ncbi:MAG: lactate dehydrogenase [Fibrella sp.]|nr:lactate dehydrogenase [Armatimonadota bacterium]
MDVALLGASGDCGREIAAQLVASRLLAPTERLQLVGREGSSSARVLHGFVSDLLDAHAEYAPELDVALSPEEIVADLWIVACGATPGTDAGRGDRALLAAVNAPIFGMYADALARSGQGHEIVVVVSNPVELATLLFARAVGRDRVLGIGAYQDSLRFRREIAADLGVRRQRVSGFMIGEHGDAQMPVWSSVRVFGMETDELADAVTRLRGGTETHDFVATARAETARLLAMVQTGHVAEAFAEADRLPPDVRVVVRPFITHYSGSKTVRATANATVGLVERLLVGDDVFLAGQVLLHDGEFHGLPAVPFGVPVIASAGGIRRVVELPLTPDEEARVQSIARVTEAKVNTWLTL